MNVKLAVQTFSKSTVDSLIYLKDQKHPKFINADATIKFGDTFNDLFDIFNTKLSAIGMENIFKRPLSKKNEIEIFELFDRAIKYISELTIKDETGAVKKILNSKVNTGFRGFIIDMHSLKGVYEKYVANNEVIDCIPTYSMNQDHVEIFFGKNRYVFQFFSKIMHSFCLKKFSLLISSTKIFP